MTEESLFDLALNTPEAERAALLDRECADNPALRARVEALLRADGQTRGFTQPPGGGTHTFGDRTRTAVPPVGTPGILIAGRYKLLQQIGEGGMGTVWMADQIEPVKRRVAVKLIRAERGSSATILARFEAERQAIALMDHPHIAKLLDAGTTAEGAPFFVMELVKGVPLTEYCDAHRLSVPDRLALFQQICGAVQHAHQKGIIHRDLKPSNILVESHDGKPVPKVIDFGLAKATTGMQLTENTLFTGFGTVMGTPLYMAPEQATFNAVDVDTRADVYALGVILYELLTGTTPLTRDTIKKAALDEMLRLVREQEAPTPSSRLSSAEGTPSAAANRQMEPAKLGRFVRGELDWIVLKALSKDRDRRYETANGFAADVGRFLAHEPVTAGPPSARYRLRKFVQRNRGQVIAASLVLLALLAGIAGTTLGLFRAEVKRKEAEQAKEKEAEQRTRAEAESQRSFQALIALTELGAEKLIGAKPTIGPDEKEFLEQVLKLWQDYAATSGTEARDEYYRAQGAFRIASLKSGLGQREEAAAGLRNAVTLWKAVVARYPEKTDYRACLSACYHNLGSALTPLGQHTEAIPAYEAAIEIQRRVCAEVPGHTKYQSDLASAYSNLGQPLADSGRWDDAAAALRSAREIAERLVREHPSDIPLRTNLAHTLMGIGLLAARQGKWADAETAFRDELKLRTALAAERPREPSHAEGAAACLSNLGVALNRLDRHAEAFDVVQESHRLRAKLVSQYPGVPQYRAHLVSSLMSLAVALQEQKKSAEAAKRYEAAFEILERLVAENSGQQDYLRSQGLLYANYGSLVRDTGPHLQGSSDSLKWYDRSIARLTPLHRKEPRWNEVQRHLSYAHAGHAEALHRLRRSAEAVVEWDRALAFDALEERLNCRCRRAMSLAHAGRMAEATAEVDKLLASEKLNDGEVYDFACIYALACSGQPATAAESGRKAVEILRRAIALGFPDIAHLKVDKDLDPLRGRADFKKLLAELEKKSPPPPEVAPPPRAVK